MKQKTSSELEQYEGTVEPLFIADVARILRASERTVYRKLAAGTFPIKPLPSFDKRPRFSPLDVRRYVLEGK